MNAVGRISLELRCTAHLLHLSELVVKGQVSHIRVAEGLALTDTQQHTGDLCHLVLEAGERDDRKAWDGGPTPRSDLKNKFPKNSVSVSCTEFGGIFLKVFCFPSCLISITYPQEI